MRLSINSHIDLTSCIYVVSYLGYCCFSPVHCWKQSLPACTQKMIHQHPSTTEHSVFFTATALWSRGLLFCGIALLCSYLCPCLRRKPSVPSRQQLIVPFLYLLLSLLRLLFSLYLGKAEQSKSMPDRGFSVGMDVKGGHSPCLYFLHQYIFCLTCSAFSFVYPRLYC